MSQESLSQPIPPVRPAYMDAVEAAALLHTDRLAVLKLIEDGKLKTYGGKPGNPFVRTAEVDKLVAELVPPDNQDKPLDAKTVHRNDPVRKIRLRIQQDAKWDEVDEVAMRAWAKELDLLNYPRMRRVAQDAIAQLQTLIKVLAEAETEAELARSKKQL